MANRAGNPATSTEVIPAGHAALTAEEELGEQRSDTSTRLAGLSQRCLGRFASAAYKDSRAPQNLYPIAGLERELRRRLGDPRLLYRALREAARTR